MSGRRLHIVENIWGAPIERDAKSVRFVTSVSGVPRCAVAEQGNEFALATRFFEIVHIRPVSDDVPRRQI